MIKDTTLVYSGDTTGTTYDLTGTTIVGEGMQDDGGGALKVLYAGRYLLEVHCYSDEYTNMASGWNNWKLRILVNDVAVSQDATFENDKTQMYSGAGGLAQADNPFRAGTVGVIVNCAVNDIIAGQAERLDGNYNDGYLHYTLTATRVGD